VAQPQSTAAMASSDFGDLSRGISFAPNVSSLSPLLARLDEEAKAARKRCDWVTANTKYTEAIATEHSTERYFNRALCRLELNLLEDALADARQVLTMDARSAKAYELMGQVYHFMQEGASGDEAVHMQLRAFDCFAAAYKLNPNRKVSKAAIESSDGEAHAFMRDMLSAQGSSWDTLNEEERQQLLDSQISKLALFSAHAQRQKQALDEARLAAKLARSEAQVNANKLQLLKVQMALVERHHTIPAHWDPMRDDDLVTYIVLATSSAEYKEVAHAFNATMEGKAHICEIHRLQSLHLWRQYELRLHKRQKEEARIRAHGKGAAVEEPKLERRWLFHGTDHATMHRIAQSGFNRDFCGKNATVLGRGVYFARDASYSSCATYSVPDGAGFQTMLACRVIVGAMCVGHSRMCTPEPRPDLDMLCDTSVDRLVDPTKFVAYHDAQAYPEYALRFVSGR